MLAHSTVWQPLFWRDEVEAFDALVLPFRTPGTCAVIFWSGSLSVNCNQTELLQSHSIAVRTQTRGICGFPDPGRLQFLKLS